MIHKIQSLLSSAPQSMSNCNINIPLMFLLQTSDKGDTRHPLHQKPAPVILTGIRVATDTARFCVSMTRQTMSCCCDWYDPSDHQDSSPSSRWLCCQRRPHPMTCLWRRGTWRWISDTARRLDWTTACQTPGRTDEWTDLDTRHNNRTRSTGTVHTSAKAHLTSVTIQMWIWSGSVSDHQNLTICSVANRPWKFHANPFRSFCTKLLTDRQTDKQTDNDDYISCLAEVIIAMSMSSRI